MTAQAAEQLESQHNPGESRSDGARSSVLTPSVLLVVLSAASAVFWPSFLVTILVMSSSFGLAVMIARRARTRRLAVLMWVAVMAAVVVALRCALIMIYSTPWRYADYLPQEDSYPGESLIVPVLAANPNAWWFGAALTAVALACAAVVLAVRERKR